MPLDNIKITQLLDTLLDVTTKGHVSWESADEDTFRLAMDDVSIEISGDPAPTSLQNEWDEEFWHRFRSGATWLSQLVAAPALRIYSVPGQSPVAWPNRKLKIVHDQAVVCAIQIDRDHEQYKKCSVILDFAMKQSAHRFDAAYSAFESNLQKHLESLTQGDSILAVEHTDSAEALPQVGVGTGAANQTLLETLVDPEPMIRTGADLGQSGLVGSWADRDDLGSSSEFARDLRRQAETRVGTNDAPGY